MGLGVRAGRLSMHIGVSLTAPSPGKLCAGNRGPVDTKEESLT